MDIIHRTFFPPPPPPPPLPLHIFVHRSRKETSFGYWESGSYSLWSSHMQGHFQFSPFAKRKSSFFFRCPVCFCDAGERNHRRASLTSARQTMLLPPERSERLKDLNLNLFSPFRQIWRTHNIQTHFIWGGPHKLAVLWSLAASGLIMRRTAQHLRPGVWRMIVVLQHLSTHFPMTRHKRSSRLGERSRHYWTWLMVILSVESLSKGFFQQALKSGVGSPRPQAVQPYAR